MLKKVIRDGSGLWFGLVLMIALSLAFLLPVTPEDYWWYVRVGQQIASTGHIPAADTFTYSIAGQAIYYHSWGASLLFWWIYKIGGLTLTVLLRGIIVAVTYTTVWLTAREAGAGRISSSLVMLAAVLASSNNWAIRPQLLVYPLFALSLWILMRWQTGHNKEVLFLPLIALAWGNLHASFVVLLALTAAALVLGKGNRNILLLAILGILAALFINPRGWHTWEYVGQMLTSNSNMQFSSEWGQPINSGWQMNLFFAWLLLFPLLAAFSRRKLSALEWSWFVGFGALALWGLRYGIWFILILAVLTAKLLADWERQYLRAGKPGNYMINLVILVLLVFLPIMLLPGIRQSWWSKAPENTANTPIAATAWLKANPKIQGPLFSEMGFSSYLEFALPEYPVWIDTRVQLFPTSMWQDYAEINNAAWDWQTSLDRTGANLLMVSLETQSKLITALEQSSGWCKVYGDETAQIYTRGKCTLQ